MTRREFITFVGGGTAGVETPERTWGRSVSESDDLAEQ
jgi:hypothetical protein